MNNRLISLNRLGLNMINVNWRLMVITIILFTGLYMFSSMTYYDGSGTKGLKVVLIRHGEKPDKGDNLSCSGLNRSLKLPEILRTKYGIPDYIFVPAPGTGKQTKNCRMLQTILPFATKYNLSVNTTCAVDDIDKLTQKIKSYKGTVLVVWEHNEFMSIAKGLGVAEGGLNWDDSDYDGIWVITYKHGTAVLTKDKEGIVPSASCAF